MVIKFNATCYTLFFSLLMSSCKYISSTYKVTTVTDTTRLINTTNSYNSKNYGSTRACSF